MKLRSLSSSQQNLLSDCLPELGMDSGAKRYIQKQLHSIQEAAKTPLAVPRFVNNEDRVVTGH